MRAEEKEFVYRSKKGKKRISASFLRRQVENQSKGSKHNKSFYDSTSSIITGDLPAEGELGNDHNAFLYLEKLCMRLTIVYFHLGEFF